MKVRLECSDNCDDEVKDWLDNASRKINDAINSKTLGIDMAMPSMHSMHTSLAAYGNACMFIDVVSESRLVYKPIALVDMLREMDSKGDT